MNIVDSTLWLEYFAGTEAGEMVSGIIENLESVNYFER